MKRIPEKCEEFENPLFLLAFIYADISNEDYFIKFNQCQKKKDKKAKWILRYENARFFLTKDEYKLIKKIHENIANEEGESIDIKIIDKTLSVKVNKIYSLRSILEKLKKDTPVNILKRAYLYSQSKNSGAFETQVEKLLYLPNIYKTLSYYSRRNEKNYKEIILKIHEKERHSKIFNVFLIKEMENLNREERVFFEDLVTIDIGTYYKELRSPSYAQKYPDVWMKWAYNHLAPNLFYKEFSQINFEDLPLSQMISFEYYRGGKEDSLKKYIPLFEKIKKSNNYLDNSIFYEIMNNETLQKDLFSSNSKIVPTISMRRDFYRKNLEAFNAINSNLYSLFILGDIDYRYFIYALAVRTYGLPSTRFLQVQ